jgi:hypothetical protein
MALEINYYDGIAVQDAGSPLLDVLLVNLYDTVGASDGHSVKYPLLIRAYDSPSLTDSGSIFRRLTPLTDRWALPTKERLVFNTEILQSHNRTEQRIAKRQGQPERQLMARIVLTTDADMARFEALMHGRLKESWALPLWPVAEIHTGAIAAGQGTISLDTHYAGFAAGGYAMIWQSRSVYDIVAIGSVSDSAIVLASTPANSYSGTKFIIPCVAARCMSVARLKRFHGAAIVEMAFRVESHEDVPDYSAGMMYDNYVVMTTPAKFSGNGFDYSHDLDVAVLDAGTGPFEVVSNSAHNIVTGPHKWICESKQAAWELRQFLHRVNGRQKGFLMPTFGYDIELSRGVGAGDTGIYVVGRDYAFNMSVNEMRTYVAFRPDVGDIIVRKVTGMSLVDGDEELLTIDAAPGAAFDAGDYLCWVDLCRLASDEIEFDWYNRGRCTVEAALLRITGYSEPEFNISRYDNVTAGEEAAISVS